jgi:RNA polymerase sigma-70 factor, ECF subfamily
VQPFGTSTVKLLMQTMGTADPVADEVLVRAVLAGEADAFKTLIRQYERLVLLIVFRMVKREVDREDLCQDVFLKVYDKLQGFRFGSKLSTWIGTIAYNTCVNYLRKNRISLLGEYEHEEEEGGYSSMKILQKTELSEQPDELFISKESKLSLWKFVEELTPMQQTVIGLFHQQEMKMEEIADIMNMPMGSVKSHLHRGRQALKTKLLELNK